MQHDPYQWVEPTVYQPDRFELSGDHKWNKTADGKQRSPLAFPAFFGGKRICIGKTFTEVLTRFTIPIIYHHLDFDFVDKEKQINGFESACFSSLADPDMPFKVTIRNKVKL